MPNVRDKLPAETGAVAGQLERGVRPRCAVHAGRSQHMCQVRCRKVGPVAINVLVREQPMLDPNSLLVAYRAKQTQQNAGAVDRDSSA